MNTTILQGFQLRTIGYTSAHKPSVILTKVRKNWEGGRDYFGRFTTLQLRSR